MHDDDLHTCPCCGCNIRIEYNDDGDAYVTPEPLRDQPCSTVSPPIAVYGGRSVVATTRRGVDGDATCCEQGDGSNFGPRRKDRRVFGAICNWLGNEPTHVTPARRFEHYWPGLIGGDACSPLARGFDKCV
jgi:hypothetical protein